MGTPTILTSLCAVLLAAGAPQVDRAPAHGHTSKQQQIFTVDSGIVSLHFDLAALETLRWSVSSKGHIGRQSSSVDLMFPLDDASALGLRSRGQFNAEPTGGSLFVRGAVLLTGPDLYQGLSPLTVEMDADGLWVLPSAPSSFPDHQRPPFELSTVVTHFDSKQGLFRMEAELTLAEPWAVFIGEPEKAGLTLGTLSVEAWLRPSGARTLDDALGPLPAGPARLAAPGTIGPDVVVELVGGVTNYGKVGDITGYALGTTSCNIGDEEVAWFPADTFPGPPNHPVIAQHLYRLKDGKLEQIGASWVKHGFAVLANNCADGSVCAPNPTGQYLGIGCSDMYLSGFNGNQGNMAPRYSINPVTGAFDWPFPTSGETGDAIFKRMQVHDADLAPALNANASYFAEGHYITPDDAAAGNGDNNASYMPATIIESPVGVYKISFRTGVTRVGSPAIVAWADNDPGVTTVNIDAPGDGRFILAYDVTPIGAGLWHYEYALHNLNSDRSGGSFSVPVPNNVTVTNVGFHGIASHSGSPYDSTDWNHTIESCGLPAGKTVLWTTDAFDVNALANSLRWGTLYNFRFDADAPPVVGNVTVGLFKPGSPGSLAVSAQIPDGPMEAVAFLTSDPPYGAIDARQPSNPDGSNPVGWQAIDLTFNACASVIARDSFLVEHASLDVLPDPPTVNDVTIAGNGTITVHLSRPIEVAAWTTITHVPSGTGTTIGYLPGDARGNGIVTPADILAMVDALNGVGGPRPIWHTDIDRSQEPDAADLLRTIDLLNGSDAFEVFLQRTLP